MATDRDGYPFPPVGSKVRFKHTLFECSFEWVITKLNQTYLTLAKNYKHFVSGEMQLSKRFDVTTSTELYSPKRGKRR